MPQLNADQQEKLSKIMAVPTKAAPLPTTPPTPIAPLVGQAVPVLPSYQVADLPAAPAQHATGITTVPTGTTVVGSSAATMQKKSNSILGILLLVGGLILLAGYTYFWLMFFKII